MVVGGRPTVFVVLGGLCISLCTELFACGAGCLPTMEGISGEQSSLAFFFLSLFCSFVLACELVESGGD